MTIEIPGKSPLVLGQREHSGGQKWAPHKRVPEVGEETSTPKQQAWDATQGRPSPKLGESYQDDIKHQMD